MEEFEKTKALFESLIPKFLFPTSNIKELIESNSQSFEMLEPDEKDSSILNEEQKTEAPNEEVHVGIWYLEKWTYAQN